MAIIVATALTPHDHEARELAGILAKRMGETIILAHVLEHGEPSHQVMRDMLEQATHEITRFGTSAYHVLLQGDPTSALTDYASRIHPRLIVIGVGMPSDTRMRGQRRKARHLIDTLHVPVLCVPRAGNLHSALLHGEPFHVLVRPLKDAKAYPSMLRETHALQEQLACDVSVLGHGDASGAHQFDLVVLEASLLEQETTWPFPDTAKPMLFVSEDAPEMRVTSDLDAKFADARPAAR